MIRNRSPCGISCIVKNHIRSHGLWSSGTATLRSKNGRYYWSYYVGPEFAGMGLTVLDVVYPDTTPGFRRAMWVRHLVGLCDGVDYSQICDGRDYLESQ